MTKKEKLNYLGGVLVGIIGIWLICNTYESFNALILDSDLSKFQYSDAKEVFLGLTGAFVFTYLIVESILLLTIHWVASIIKFVLPRINKR